MNDDELHRRAIGIATHAEEIASNAREVVEQARQAIVKLQGKDGPVQGMAANVKQTLDDARLAMAGFAENMEALKRNFFFRGYFNRRGYLRSRTCPRPIPRGCSHARRRSPDASRLAEGGPAVCAGWKRRVSD